MSFLIKPKMPEVAGSGEEYDRYDLLGGDSFFLEGWGVRCSGGHWSWNRGNFRGAECMTSMWICSWCICS